MTEGVFLNEDGDWVAHAANRCTSFRQVPGDLMAEYCRLANQYPVGKPPSFNELYEETLMHKRDMNRLRMTPKQCERHLRTRSAYERDPAAFDAMDRNAREV